MMENTKVNMQNTDKNCLKYVGTVQGKIKCMGRLPIQPIEDTHISRTLSPTQQNWLDRECSVINTYDFDTCGRDYSDRNYQTSHLKGYDEAYYTYLDQFENC